MIDFRSPAPLQCARLLGGPPSFFCRSMPWARRHPVLSFGIDGLAEGDTIYLANYYGNKMYYADTATVGKKDASPTRVPPPDKGGKYGLVLPGNAFVEFIVTGERYGSPPMPPISRAVSRFKRARTRGCSTITSLSSRRCGRSAFPLTPRAKDSTLTEAERAQLLQDLEVLNIQVEAKQDRIQEEHGETLFAKMIRMVREPDVPEAPRRRGQSAALAVLPFPGPVLGPGGFPGWAPGPGSRPAHPAGAVLEQCHAPIAGHGLGRGPQAHRQGRGRSGHVQVLRPLLHLLRREEPGDVHGQGLRRTLWTATTPPARRTGWAKPS